MHTAVINRYFAMWNETDAEQRRELIASTWTEDGSYIDPMMNGAGYAGLDAMVAGVQQHYPNHHFQLTSPIDAYQDRLRFTWELAVEGAPAVVTGTDFGVLASDGRLHTITGFFDPKPS